jgi:hypothetical protein
MMDTNLVVQRLIDEGQRRWRTPRKLVDFETGTDGEAEKLLNDIEGSPHFFVLACVMDRQQLAGRAWAIPYYVGKAVGSFGFDAFERVSLDHTKQLFQRNPETGRAMHRYPGKMAECFFQAVRKIAVDYNRDAGSIWKGNPKAALVIRRFLEFEGVGVKIATMAANILVRDFKVPMLDLSSIDISPDRQVLKYFIDQGLLRSQAERGELIYLARELHPDYPGILDIAAWEGGRAMR